MELVQIDGKKLKQIRKDKKISQVVLSELSGVSQPAICHIEVGLVRSSKPDTVKSLARALRVSQRAIVLGVDDEQKRRRKVLAELTDEAQKLGLDC